MKEDGFKFLLFLFSELVLGINFYFEIVVLLFIKYMSWFRIFLILSRRCGWIVINKFLFVKNVF